MFVNADPTDGNDGIELRGLSLDGNMATQQRPHETALSFAFGAFLRNVRGVVIADVDAYRIRQSAFQFNDCSHVNLTNVRATDMGWSGVATSRSDDVSIRDVVVVSAGLDVKHSAIHLGSGSRMRVEASVIGCTGNGIMLDSRFAPLTDVTVDATAGGCLRGVAVTGADDHPITDVFITGRYGGNRECGVMVANATNVFVVGSTIDSNGEAGIILQGREGARHCLVADCVITGNPIPIVERHGSRDNYRTRNQTVGATGMS